MNKFLLLAFALVAPGLVHADVQAGFAERDITPEVGMEVPGGYGKTFSKKIHDPCKVRACVFDDGAKRVALVGLDALGVPRKLVLEARAKIAERCGIPADAVLINASHSHSSGPLIMIQPGDFDKSSDFVKDLAYNKSSCADAGYVNKVRDAIVEAVAEANEARADGTASFGTGREDSVAYNRRIRMWDGLAASHPGKGNPDNIDFAGPTDPEVGVIAFWNPEGKLDGCVVNFACHATTSGPWVGANWIYYMERVIQGFYGPETKVVFLQGACGDVTQVNNLDPHANPEGDAWAQMVGGRVGAEALKVLVGMSQTRTGEVPVAALQETWKIPRRKPAPERVKAAYELATKDAKEAGADWVWAKETVLLDALIAQSPKVEVEVQVVQIGPVACITNPAEYFCQYGLDLKKDSRFPITFVCELANGCVGYVPTLEAFSETTGGGYETRLTSYSNLHITAGDQFREVGIELAQKLTPGPLPERPAAPAFKAGWTYGNQPPQLK